MIGRANRNVEMVVRVPEFLGEQEPPRKRGLFSKGRTPQRCESPQNPLTGEEKITSSEKANSPYKNIHLQKLRVEKLRGDSGGFRRSEGRLCLLQDGG